MMTYNYIANLLLTDIILLAFVLLGIMSEIVIIVITLDSTKNVLQLFFIFLF